MNRNIASRILFVYCLGLSNTQIAVRTSIHYDNVLTLFIHPLDDLSVLNNGDLKSSDVGLMLSLLTF